MKKIAIDVTSLSDQYKNRGIGTFTANLVSELIENSQFEWHLIGFDDISDRFSNVKFYSLGRCRLSNPLNPVFFLNSFMPFVKSIQPDLYFAPHFERGLPSKICKTAVAIHDYSPIINKRFSQKGAIYNFLKGIFYKYNFRRAKKADLIVTISDFIKQDLIRAGFRKDQVKVAHLGLSKDFDVSVIKKVENKQEILNKYTIKKPYLLYYGGLEVNKNVDKLLLAYREVINKKDISFVLVDKNLYKEKGEIVSKGDCADKIKKIILKLKVEDRIILPRFIEWADIPIVLHESEAFVHLSSYEGFGFAVVESMAAGAATIAADRSCYPEVLGDGALLIDPDDKSQIVKAILKVSKDKNFKKDLILKGKARAKRYTWGKTAERVLSYFKQVI